MKMSDVCGAVATAVMLMCVRDVSAQGVAAQNEQRPGPNQSTGTPIVTVGCVNRAEQTGSLAPEPGVRPATPATATILANSSDMPTNAFLLAGATPANTSSDARARAAAGEPVSTAPATFVLDAARPDLERHLGHLVEVTGTLKTVAEGDKAARTNVAHVQVASIKMLATACPKTAERK
jgi:hypothetical protein